MTVSSIDLNIRSPADQVLLQQDLQELSSWADTWGMNFNPSKCYILSTSGKGKFNTYLYSLCGSVLSKVPNTKYLGVTISQNLQWEEHVNNISARASKTLGFLRRNLQGCPKEFKQLAYSA